MNTPLKNLQPFDKAFFTAAFFTAEHGDFNFADYTKTGNADKLWEKLNPVNKDALLYALLDWRLTHADILKDAGTGEQNGHDLWFTQGGHSSSLWDREYSIDLSAQFQKAADEFGEYKCYIYLDSVVIE